MIPGARSPYSNRPPWLRLALTVLGIFILLVFVVDKLVLAPSGPAMPVATVVDHLNAHNVRRVIIPAGQISLELNDGKTVSTKVMPDRDLWPAIKRSGADVTIVARTAADYARSPLTYVFQFVPFVIMALLLLFILRTTRRSAP